MRFYLKVILLYASIFGFALFVSSTPALYKWFIILVLGWGAFSMLLCVLYLIVLALGILPKSWRDFSGPGGSD